MVMQNLYIVNGRPSWSSKFLIAAINNSGKFDPLQFKFDGQGDEYGCIAFSKNAKGIMLESPKVTWAMVKQEGWLGKNGSKWKTMPQVMFRYRAASFFSSFYCPEITMGMSTAEEMQDITPAQATDVKYIEVDKLEDLSIEEVKVGAELPTSEQKPEETKQAITPKEAGVSDCPEGMEEITDQDTGEITYVKKEEPSKDLGLGIAEVSIEEKEPEQPVTTNAKAVTPETKKAEPKGNKNKTTAPVTIAKKMTEYEEISSGIAGLVNEKELKAFKAKYYSIITDANVFTVFERKDLVSQLEEKEKELKF